MAVKEQRLVKDKEARGRHFRELARSERLRADKPSDTIPSTSSLTNVQYQTVDVSDRRRMVIEIVPAGPDDTADLPSLRRQRLLKQLSELDLGSCD